ncbi:MAG: HEAT repeat domain-containing protein [Acidobacteriota bacterium]|nr:HEAT repeat domain-containing protein [Acidobacteriota bacterium]
MERIGEAVCRATERLGRPVNIQDIAEELDLDSELHPTGSSSLIGIVSDAAKESIDAGKGTRRRRISQRVYRIVQLGSTTYFAADNTPEAYNYLHLCQLKSRWADICADERMSKLECASLPSLRVGRAMLIKAEVEDVDGELTEMLRAGQMTESTRREAEAMKLDINEALTNIGGWLATNVDDELTIPSEVNLAVPGWTAAELHKFMGQLSPRIMSVENYRKLIAIMKDNIRRVPNPDYTHCFSKGARTAFHYLYDITDTLIYSGKQWGGYECSSQAMIASVELERLRDVRFVLPTLEAEDYNQRLAGAACLAFLQSTEGNKKLMEIATHDLDPGVRRSALWAYGFVGGEGLKDLLHNRAGADVDANVRRFAREAEDINLVAWWLM